MTINNITTTGKKASSMAKHGRYGDTEMAHVTPGEMVLPHSIQTPRVMQTVASEFQRQGVPADRYVVQSTKNSKNPDTGKGEYFLKSIIKTAAPIVGGMVGGPAGAAVGSAIAGGIGGGALAAGGAAGGAMAGGTGGGSNLPQPVQFLAQTGGAGQSEIAKVGSITQEGQIAPEKPQPQTAPGAMQQMPQANTPLTAVPPSFNPMQVGGIQSINSITGQPQFYDTKGDSKAWAAAARPMNPKTKEQEFFDPKAYLAANPDVADAGVDPLNHYLKHGLNEQRPLFPANYQAPESAPNAPAPANAQTGNPVWNDAGYLEANPDVKAAMLAGTMQGSGLDHYYQYGKEEGRELGAGNMAEALPVPIEHPAAPAAPTAQQMRIIGLYNQGGGVHNWGGSIGKARVMTASGEFFEVNTDPNTGEVSYNKVDGVGDYRMAMDNRSLMNNASPANSLAFNNSAHRKVINVGDTFDWTDPSAPAVPKTSGYYAGYKAPSKIETTTTAEEEPKAPDLGEDLYGDGGEESYPSWYDGLKSDIAGIKESLSSNSSSSTGGTTTPAPNPNANMASTSKLTPQRENRFRSRAREGGLARNF